MKISFKMYMFFSLMFLGANLVFAANIQNQPNSYIYDPLTKLVYGGISYTPDKQTKPAIVYEDMEGDKKDEMVVAMQMLPIKGDGWFQTFAFVYRTDNKGNRKVLLKTIHLGDLLGTEVGDDDQEKVSDVVDINSDGKKAVALWSTLGMHYRKLNIIGMRNGRVVQLFNGGSDDELTYEPRKNKNIITAGARDWYPPYNDIERWREDVWEWNGKKFAYSKKKSSVTVIKNGIAQ
jgi:hypothetical protein